MRLPSNADRRERFLRKWPPKSKLQRSRRATDFEAIGKGSGLGFEQQPTLRKTGNP
jgi:hypothetical protein